MTMKKTMKSVSQKIVAGSDDKTVFPKGYTYQVGDAMFTVLASYSDSGEEFRRVRDETGNEEIMTVTMVRNEHSMAKNGGLKVHIHEIDQKIANRSDDQ